MYLYTIQLHTICITYYVLLLHKYVLLLFTTTVKKKIYYLLMKKNCVEKKKATNFIFMCKKNIYYKYVLKEIWSLYSNKQKF